MNINILSVDWDYFFPNAAHYDWGHKEEPIFFETLWPIRWSNYNMRTDLRGQKGHQARSHFIVSADRLNNFWHKLFGPGRIDPPEYLVITESHKDLYEVVTSLKFKKSDVVKIWNYDAHHDMGYGASAQPMVPACDNWAKLLLDEWKISGYRLIYPEWRRHEPEDKFPSGATYRLVYPEFGQRVMDYYSDEQQVMPMPAYFNVVFACRSSAWTPSWYDHLWIEFIEYWKHKDMQLWHTKMSCEYALKARPFDIDQAKQLEKQMTEWREQNGKKDSKSNIG